MSSFELAIDDLFVANTSFEVEPIIITDASGSMKHAKFPGTFAPVFAKVSSVISDRKMFGGETTEQHGARFVFWNSDNDKRTQTIFNKGIFSVPTITTLQSVEGLFQIVTENISNDCLTFPHLGIDEVVRNSRWIHLTKPTHVFFITDGQIGYGQCPSGELRMLKDKFVQSVKNLLAISSNIRLHIIAIEVTSTDYATIESAEISAGGDVFKLLQDNSLTKSLSSMISYNAAYPDGYVHLENQITPPGHLPFRKRYFSVAKLDEFIPYVAIVIKENASNLQELLYIVQGLNSTCSTYAKDAPLHDVNRLVAVFCEMFNGTLLEPSLLEHMMHQSLSAEQSGKVMLISDYRSGRNKAFKEATEMLQRSAKSAIGITERFLTFPLDDIVVGGSHFDVKETIRIGKTNYDTGVIVEGLALPAIPFKSVFGESSQQCLRQYVRQIISGQFRHNALDDVIIYIVMALSLHVVLSDVDNGLKNAYKAIAKVMLLKTRLNQQTTELARLESGQWPTPNVGGNAKFYEYMRTAAGILRIDRYKPMTIWWMLCCATDNAALMNGQYVHCVEDIAFDFGSSSEMRDPATVLELLKHFVRPVFYKSMPESTSLSYVCPVTRENTSETGGYRIANHLKYGGTTCQPIGVFGKDGRLTFLSKLPMLCPDCWAKLSLTAEVFVSVRPITDIVEGKIFPNEIVSPFNSPSAETGLATTFSRMSMPNNAGDSNNGKRGRSRQSRNQTANITSGIADPEKLLYLMKGTVGAGKSTYSAELASELASRGFTVLNEGTDKYCSTGIPIKTAIGKVKDSLRGISRIPSPKIAVIIDTCGEQSNGYIHFDHNFSGWTRIEVAPNFCREQIGNYAAWTLRNVLKRSACQPGCNYWLNPHGAGFGTCVDVHQKKISNVFGFTGRIFDKSATSPSSAISQLDHAADEYQAYLDREHVMTQKIAELVAYAT